MALLFELAEYSLSLLENIPEEISWGMIFLREWGIPSHKTKTTKNPMFTSIHKFGIKSTLYNPRRTKYKEEDL